VSSIRVAINARTTAGRTSSARSGRPAVATSSGSDEGKRRAADEDGCGEPPEPRRRKMCRWLAYSGSPILLEELLYKTEHSLIDQSLHSRLGVETTNGDGFGVGWYGSDGAKTPAQFRGVGPAWSDLNLRELARSVSSPLFLAHIRASTGTPVQQTNCHPFRHGQWLWLHNGAVRGFETVKRDLVLAVDPELFSSIAGSTDSEVMFYLALTFGLQDQPVEAVERMVGFVESTGRQEGIEHPIQMTVATTDGDRLWVFRYSSEGSSRSLYFSTALATLREMYPNNERLHRVSDETRIVVSEPLGELVGAWQPVPESSYGVIQEGADALGDFRPRVP
jgi:predicted glutamine amidotransferase